MRPGGSYSWGKGYRSQVVIHAAAVRGYQSRFGGQAEGRGWGGDYEGWGGLLVKRRGCPRHSTLSHMGRFVPTHSTLRGAPAGAGTAAARRKGGVHSPRRIGRPVTRLLSGPPPGGHQKNRRNITVLNTLKKNRVSQRTKKKVKISSTESHKKMFGRCLKKNRGYRTQKKACLGHRER